MYINQRFAAALRRAGLPVPLDYLLIDTEDGTIRFNARGRGRFSGLCGASFVRERTSLKSLVGRLAHAGAFMEASTLIYLFGPFEAQDAPAEGHAPGEIRAIVQFARQCRSLGYQDEAGSLVVFANDLAREEGLNLPALVFQKTSEADSLAVGAA